MTARDFNYHLSDSQGTFVRPVDPSAFDFDRFQEYERALLERNKGFWESSSGVQVYRRFRVPDVFSYDCKDMKRSLALQLGALQESMQYEADIPNFLEPWYGIGTISSAYGVSYLWEKGQAPATKPPFSSIKEAAEYDPCPVDQTEIGTHSLRMIEYFLEQTQGKLPMSFTDTQSPMNIASYLVETNSFFMGLLDDPENLIKLLTTITALAIEFTHKQKALIGEALVLPGHGFASSRMFRGIGMSDDNMVMLSPKQYGDLEVPFIERFSKPFGGAGFHSCGDWSRKINAVKHIKNLVMVDGAFSQETDPSPNPAELFAEAFANTGIIVNARVVGKSDIVVEQVKKLWKPGMKLIIVTYCQTPQEQHEVCQSIYGICL